MRIEVYSLIEVTMHYLDNNFNKRMLVKTDTTRVKN